MVVSYDGRKKNPFNFDWSNLPIDECDLFHGMFSVAKSAGKSQEEEEKEEDEK